ncbi:MAG TPA: hypothetical protein DD719_02600 [Desulfotomaculum sp.]|nr:hypothetical protein [Desulfotomaculum sp.]
MWLLFGEIMREDKKYDVVIIGAGIGGLTCGALLTKNGFKALVIEQHSIPGGYCTSFKRNGFLFDAAVHFSEGLGEGGSFYQILKELKVEKEIELHKIDPLYRVFFGDESFSVSADLYEYISMLSKKFPIVRTYYLKRGSDPFNFGTIYPELQRSSVWLGFNSRSKWHK